MSIAELFDKGGLVVWILAAYSSIGLAIILERQIMFLRWSRMPQNLVARLTELLDTPKAAEEVKVLNNPEARVIQAVIDADQQDVTDLAAVAARVRAEELHRMEFGLGTLSVLGNTAPLLGLLGTITGMIKAFMVIEQAGGKVDAQALAGGIWEAMLTTGAGLAVAIPVLLLLHFLEGMVDKRAKSMQRVASMVIEQLPHAPESNMNDQVSHRDSLAHAV